MVIPRGGNNARISQGISEHLLADLGIRRDHGREVNESKRVVPVIPIDKGSYRIF